MTWGSADSKEWMCIFLRFLVYTDFWRCIFSFWRNYIKRKPVSCVFRAKRFMLCGLSQQHIQGTLDEAYRGLSIVSVPLIALGQSSSISTDSLEDGEQEDCYRSWCPIGNIWWLPLGNQVEVKLSAYCAPINLMSALYYWKFHRGYRVNSNCSPSWAAMGIVTALMGSESHATPCLWQYWVFCNYNSIGCI